MAQSMTQSASLADAGAKPKKASKRNKTPGAKKIRAKELGPFTRQLSAMLSSGMPVVQTLEALENQSEDKVFKQVVQGIRSQIEAGASFSESLVAYPDIFDELYISMLKAGESGGLLAETTEKIAQFLEKRAKLQRKVVSAMMYPCIVLLVALSLAAGMIIWIVPVFANIYGDFGAKLPGPTQFLVTISDAIRSKLLFVILGGIGLSIAFGRFKKTEKGAYLIDKARIRFPVLGVLALKVALSRFAATFAQLSRSGVPILQALEITSSAIGNKVLGKIILSARSNVERGEPLSETLKQHSEYPSILVHMLAAGEQTGKVDDMLQRISEFYDDEVDAMLSGLTSMIEPLLISFMGIVIGGIVICMFLPIFKMHEIVQF